MTTPTFYILVLHVLRPFQTNKKKSHLLNTANYRRLSEHETKTNVFSRVILKFKPV